MELKLLVCIVNKKKLLDKILSTLIDEGVGGATVIDSTGIGRSKVDDIMIYEGFRDVLRGAQKNHYTVLVVIKKSQVKKIADSLSDVYGDFAEHAIGFYFTVPVDQVWGINFPD